MSWRSHIAPVLVVLCLGLPGAIGAEVYRVVEGTLEEGTGASVPLGGTLSISLFETPGLGVPTLQIDDFELQAPPELLTPGEPLELDGRPALLVQIADQIQRTPGTDELPLFYLRSGGEPILETPDTVTYRLLELRGTGRASGSLASGLPRRIEVEGTAHELEITLGPASPCSPPFPLPQLPTTPGGGSGGVGTGGSISIGSGGRLEVVGSPRPLLAPAPLSLETLGVTAPEGATVAQLGGEVEVRSDGPLEIDGDVLRAAEPELLDRGLTGVSFFSAVSIDVTASQLPRNLDLSFHAEAVGIQDGEGVVEPIEPLPCVFPVPTTRDSRELGPFSLVAEAGQPLVIDVEPGDRRNRVRPGRADKIRVAVLGSAEFDIRDLDADSLRLGPGQAEPRRRGRRRDVNDDGHTDLVLRFRVRDAEVAFGDDELCLSGSTTDGASVSGCDEIRTRPKKSRRRRRDRDDD